jgi:hypothetical protein
MGGHRRDCRDCGDRGGYRLGVLRKFVAGLAMAGVVVLGFSLPASADGTCYTTCSPTPIGAVGQGSVVQGSVIAPGVAASQSPSATVPVATQSVSSSGGLPFTGADIEQSLGAAALLLVAGAAFVRVSRRRARLTG